MAENDFKIAKLVHSFLSISYLLICASVEGRKNTTQETLVQHENTIKTIKTESGDIVDCVSLRKQPAFNHPILKNHKIQMQPNWSPKRLKKDALSETKKTHGELEIVECPEGTIPILRTTKSISHSNPNAISLLFNSTYTMDACFWFFGRGMYQGIESYVNTRNPMVAADQEASGVYMWVQSGYQVASNINLAGVGWMVNPTVYGDNITRFTIYWTKDNFIRTGCQDLRCPGFLQINKHVYLGAQVKPVSRYGNRTQLEMQLNIYKGQPVGYWPKDIFTGLQDAAEILSWGGKVTNSGQFGPQTFTEMGSGHFPPEGYSKACFIRNLNIFDADYRPAHPELKDLQAQITKNKCYDANVDYSKNLGAHIFLGGNGASNPACQ